MTAECQALTDGDDFFVLIVMSQDDIVVVDSFNFHNGILPFYNQNFIISSSAWTLPSASGVR